MALIEHAFSWTVMIHIPIVAYVFICGIQVSNITFVVWFLANLEIHAFVDNMKANLLEINLIHDQLIHIAQIVLTWFVYIQL